MKPYEKGDKISIILISRSIVWDARPI